MGQIIIELPFAINRRYSLKDKDFAAVLLNDLDNSATRLEENPQPTAEDLADVRAAKRARKEKGFLTVDQLEAALNL